MVEIAENIFLYTSKRTDPVSFFYELEVSMFSKIIFTIDFSGSENITLPNGEFRATTVVRPFERLAVGEASVQNASARAFLKCKYSWSVEQPENAHEYVRSR